MHWGNTHFVPQRCTKKGLLKIPLKIALTMEMGCQVWQNLEKKCNYFELHRSDEALPFQLMLIFPLQSLATCSIVQILSLLTTVIILGLIDLWNSNISMYDLFQIGLDIIIILILYSLFAIIIVINHVFNISITFCDLLKMASEDEQEWGRKLLNFRSI